ncbi:MAG: MBL fold metallo-hydrolase [Prevotella sp.]|nr:MBL fold metallo-hydrolase [Prevotella sp.]
MLTEQGYEVVNLKGGIQAWQLSQKPISTSQYEIDEFKTPGGKVARFHALVHSSIRLDVGERHIYIDPVSRLGNRTINYTTMPKADYIFVTHEHGDHLDIQVLPQLIGDSTKIVTNSRCAELLLAAGIVVPKENVLKNGDNLTLAEDLSLEAFPAYNTTEGRQQFHPKGRDNGYIITLDGLRIYVAGDTEDIPEMTRLAPSAEGDSQKAIDIAFLPCNQPYTMTPDQLVRAASIIKPRVLFPYHFGQTDVSVIPSQLKDIPVEVRLRHYE